MTGDDEASALPPNHTHTNGYSRDDSCCRNEKDGAAVCAETNIHRLHKTFALSCSISVEQGERVHGGVNPCLDCSSHSEKNPCHPISTTCLRCTLCVFDSQIRARMARTNQVGDGLQRRLQHAANKLASVRDSLAQVLSRSGCVPGSVGCLSSRSLANHKSSCEDHLGTSSSNPLFALAESDRCVEDMHAFVVVLLVSARLIKEDMDIHIDLSIGRRFVPRSTKHLILRLAYGTPLKGR